MKLYLGLVHYPVRNKREEVVCTSITNLDIHDISRSCKTFGVKNYFLITPLEAQHELLSRILGHWKSDKSSIYNPDRFEALSIAVASKSIEDAVQYICEREGVAPFVAVTGANFLNHDGDMKELVLKINLDETPCLLLFGTGWGLTASVIDAADYRLAPINGMAIDGYNHLSVRSAVAIYLDRLREASLTS